MTGLTEQQKRLLFDYALGMASETEAAEAATFWAAASTAERGRQPEIRAARSAQERSLVDARGFVISSV